MATLHVLVEPVGFYPMIWPEVPFFDIGRELKLKTYEENEGYHQKDNLVLILFVYFHCLIRF